MVRLVIWWRRKSVPLLALSVALTVWLWGPFVHCQRYIFVPPIYDEYGNEVGEDNLIELADMRSTALGFGLGHNYSTSAFSDLAQVSLLPFPAPVRPSLAPSSRTGSGLTASSTLLSEESVFPSSRRLKRQVNSSSKNLSEPGKNDLSAAKDLKHLEFGALPGLGHAAVQSSGGIATRPGSRAATGKTTRCARPEGAIECDPGAPFRTLDGSCNNLARPTWGAINQPMRRLVPAEYFDGYDVPRLTSRSNPRRLLPSARLVSRNVHEPLALQSHSLTHLSNLVQVWGQFLSHDITGTPAYKEPDGITDLRCCDGVFLAEAQQIHSDAFTGGRCHPIYIPPSDRHFNYTCMNLPRSVAARRKRDCDPDAPREVRQQVNILTAWVDASLVYGSTQKNADALRLFNGGRMKLTDKGLLPEDTNSTCVREEPGDYCFLAGEKRVNEHVGLMALHTVLVRLHNWMVTQLSQVNPAWSDETLYQEARRVMGAVMQHVTYHDWLPAVLGPEVMRQYSLTVGSPGVLGPSTWAYDPKMDPTIFNAFATAAFRFGHVMIPSLFTLGRQKVRLFTMFNRPKFILRDNGEGLLKMSAGMTHDSVLRCERFMITDLSDRLFEDKYNVSLDLAAVNIQRGRDHGLPGYNAYRKICGLPEYKSFDDLRQSEPERAEVFQRVYDDMDDIDLFTGCLSELPVAGGVVGPTFSCLLAAQFHSLKFADRFWYEAPTGPGAFTAEQLNEIRKLTVSKILCLTVPSLQHVTPQPMYTPDTLLPHRVAMANGTYVTQNQHVSCRDLPNFDLKYWFDSSAQQ